MSRNLKMEIDGPKTLYATCLQSVSECAWLYDADRFKELPAHILEMVMFYLSANQLHRYESILTDAGLDVDRAWRTLAEKPYLCNLHKPFPLFCGGPCRDRHRYCLQQSYFGALLRTRLSPGDSLSHHVDQDIGVFHVPAYRCDDFVLSDYNHVIRRLDKQTELLRFARYARLVIVNTYTLCELNANSDVIDVLRTTTESLVIMDTRNEIYDDIHLVVSDLLTNGVLQELVLVGVTLTQTNARSILSTISGVDIRKNSLTDEWYALGVNSEGNSDMNRVAEDNDVKCGYIASDRSPQKQHIVDINEDGPSTAITNSQAHIRTFEISDNREICTSNDVDLFDEALMARDVPPILQRFGISHGELSPHNIEHDNSTRHDHIVNGKHLQSFVVIQVFPVSSAFSELLSLVLPHWTSLKKLAIRSLNVVNVNLERAILRKLLQQQLSHLVVDGMYQSPYFLTAMMTCLNSYRQPMKHLSFASAPVSVLENYSVDGCISAVGAPRLNELVLADLRTSPQTFECLLTFIRNNLDLRVIVFDDWSLSDFGFSRLLDCLHGRSMLDPLRPGEELCLKVISAQLSLAVVDLLCAVIQHNDHLTTLSLCLVHPNFTHLFVRRLCTAILTRQNLVELSIQDCRTGEVLCSMFSQLYDTSTAPPPSLRSVDISGNRLTDEDIVTIASTLSHYQTITSITRPLLTCLDVRRTGTKHKHSRASMQTMFATTVQNLWLSSYEYSCSVSC